MKKMLKKLNKQKNFLKIQNLRFIYQIQLIQKMEKCVQYPKVQLKYMKINISINYMTLNRVMK